MRALPALVIVAALAAPAGADDGACRREIAKQSAHYAQAAMKALAACGDGTIAGRLPLGTDCATEPHTASRRSTAAAKAAARIAGRCCGPDGQCGTADDDPLAAIGWDLGTCPNLEGGGCGDALGTTADVVPCATCVDGAAVARLLGVVFGPAGPAPAPAPAGGCRRALVRESARLFLARSRALARCWDARFLSHHTNSCPVPGDGKAGPAIAKAEARATAAICAACGGGDGVCGGGDDVGPAAIGVGSECPAVQVPGGTACAGPLATLGDIVGCVACVAAFAGTCADAVGVPALETYPVGCNPPSPTCAAGVTCAADGDCPTGYACQDNGGDTRYCVGPTCASDAACIVGAICRPYCTFAGCAPPRCQCPGFGCPGADEVCIDRGGLACNKLCTQDSDCADPFGFVCVNAGFADGICIATIPCQ